LAQQLRHYSIYLVLSYKILKHTNFSFLLKFIIVTKINRIESTVRIYENINEWKTLNVKKLINDVGKATTVIKFGLWF